MPNFRAIKISRGTTRPVYTEICGNYHIITPKNPYLNQITKKNTCQNFPTPKNLEI